MNSLKYDEDGVRMLLTLVLPDSSEHDLSVDAATGLATREVSAQIGAALDLTDGPDTSLWLGCEELHPDMPWDLQPVQEGARLGWGEAIPGSQPSEAQFELCVVGGPGTGRVIPLQRNTEPQSITIGSGSMCKILVAGIPATAAVIMVIGDSVRIFAPDDVDALLDGVHPKGEIWDAASLLVIAGEIVLTLRRPTSGDLASSTFPGPDGLRLVAPSARHPPTEVSQATRSFVMPEAAPAVLSWIPPVLGAGAAVVAALVTGIIFSRTTPVTDPSYGPWYVVSLLVFLFYGGPAVLALRIWLSPENRDPRTWTRANRRMRATYREALASLRQQVTEAERVLYQESWDLAPDPARLLAAARLEGPGLWQRKRDDADFLHVRIGVSKRRFAALEGGTAAAREQIEASLPTHTAPVSIRLDEVGGLDVAGPPAAGRSLLTWTVAQLAVEHSPRDVQIWVLTDEAAAPDWAWTRWLPHCRRERSAASRTTVAVGLSQVRQRLDEISRIVSERRPGILPAEPELIVILDYAEMFSEPSLEAVLRITSAESGVHALRLESDARSIQPWRAALVVQVGDRVEIRHGPDPTVTGVLPDLVESSIPAEIARALAPLRDVSMSQDLLPDSVRLTELLFAGEASEDAVMSRWTTGSPSSSSVIGVGADGPVTVDFVTDGPHVLIGGSTGAGKSELLRTWLASLAVANRPEDFAFLMVDYKGGAALGPLVDLPHCTGLITDLDGYSGTRILDSLGAELRRRERLIRSAGAVDFSAYQRSLTRAKGEPGPVDAPQSPLARLLIVVDEYAALRSEQPELLSAVIGFARRGRSLGVHLVLSSQRVDDDRHVQSITNLRIALRTFDAEASRLLIGQPDAAQIPAARQGRALIRTGERPARPVQIAYSGSYVRPERVIGPRVRVVDWSAMPEEDAPYRVLRPNAETELELLVRLVGSASKRLGLAPSRMPVLPPLPELLLMGGSSEDAATGLRVEYGVGDLPDRQARELTVFDVATDDHLLVIGAPRSGRSTLLRTLAAGFSRMSTADVHLYALDSGDRSLLPVAQLPQCGAVVTRSQPERAERLVRQLLATWRARQAQLAQNTWSSIGDQRAAAPPNQRWPHLVLLVDEVKHPHGPDLDQSLVELLRAGHAGIHLVLTGTRESFADGRFTERVPDQLLLLGADLPQRKSGHRAPGFIPGRAWRQADGVELQIFIMGGDATGKGDSFAEFAAAARVRDAEVPVSRRPFLVGELILASDRFQVGGAEGLPIGREAVLAWLRGRHQEGAAAVLLGPRRAGKTWILRELARRLRQDGAQGIRDNPVPLPSEMVETPDAIAGVLEPLIRDAASPAEALLERAESRRGDLTGRLVFLLDEVGRLTGYSPAAVSFLRDLGQAGAWVVYTGTQGDWSKTRRWALTMPGSSFGNDTGTHRLGPLEERTAHAFLVGTAANLGVVIEPETADRVIELVGTWPFYLQVMGSALVRARQAGDAGSDRRGLRHVVEAELLDGWTQHFETLWAELTTAGRAAMLSSPGRYPASLAPGQRTALADVGLLLPGDQWLLDQPFLDWIARNTTGLKDQESQP